MISFDYYTDNRLFTVTDANGKVGKIEYNAVNKVSKLIDPRSTPEIPMVAELTYPSTTETVFTDALGYKTYYKNNSNLKEATINMHIRELLHILEESALTLMCMTMMNIWCMAMYMLNLLMGVLVAVFACFRLIVDVIVVSI